MRTILLALVFTPLFAAAQYYPEEEEESGSPVNNPVFFLGVGTGINNYSALLGLGGDLVFDGDLPCGLVPALVVGVES